MQRGFIVVLLSVAGAGCGGSSSLPTRIPVSIAGEWTGTVTFQSGQAEQGTYSAWSSSSEGSIAEGVGIATGQFTMPGTAPATFSGTVAGTTFEGTMTVTDSQGCTFSSRLAGTVSERALVWAMPPPPGNDCGWSVRTTLQMSRR